MIFCHCDRVMHRIHQKKRRWRTNKFFSERTYVLAKHSVHCNMATQSLRRLEPFFMNCRYFSLKYKKVGPNLWGVMGPTRHFQIKNPLSWGFRRVSRISQHFLPNVLKTLISVWYCIRRTRREIYAKIWPEPEGLAEGAARGLRPYFTVYPDLSPNTDIIPFLTMIYWVFECCL